MKWWVAIAGTAFAAGFVFSSCLVPPTRMPTPPIQTQEALKILNHSSYVDSHNYFRVVGEVQNVSTRNTKSNRVTVTFYDSQGTPALTGFNNCFLQILRPEEKSPFEVVFAATPPAENYKLTTSCQVASDEPYRDVEARDFRSQIDADGSYRVWGTIVNEGSRELQLAMIFGSFYDGSGKTIAVGFTLADTLPLRPRGTSGFTMVIDAKVASVISTYSLQAEGH